MKIPQFLFGMELMELMDFQAQISGLNSYIWGLVWCSEANYFLVPWLTDDHHQKNEISV